MSAPYIEPICAKDLPSSAASRCAQSSLSNDVASMLRGSTSATTRVSFVGSAFTSVSP